MKLSRKQELYLISLGLQSMLDSLIPTRNGTKTKVQPKKKSAGRKWTKEQRKNFEKTWEEKRKKSLPNTSK